MLIVHVTVRPPRPPIYRACILNRFDMGTHSYLQIWRCAVTGLVLCAVPE